jgi:hypothetical protein
LERGDGVEEGAEAGFRTGEREWERSGVAVPFPEKEGEDGWGRNI